MTGVEIWGSNSNRQSLTLCSKAMIIGFAWEQMWITPASQSMFTMLEENSLRMMHGKKVILLPRALSLPQPELITSLQRSYPRQSNAPIGQWSMGTNERIADAQAIGSLCIFSCGKQGVVCGI